MSRILPLLIAAIFAATSVIGETAPRPLGVAIEAMRAGNWDNAARIARRDGAVAADVIEWHRLRAGRGSYAETLAFLARRPDWPGLPWLRRKSEPALAQMTGEQRRAFFDTFPAQTALGALAHALALEDAGQGKKARQIVIAAFRTMRMSRAELTAYFDKYGQTLKPHITARLDHALWNGWSSDAKRLLSRVSADWQRLAEARLALRAREDGVNALIDKVPGALQNDPGLAFERFLWRARKGQSNAVDLLLQRSTSAASLGRPEEWAGRRRSLARAAMRSGNHGRAYQIASTHFLETGRHFADLEWLSGYLALRFLNKPELALTHFDRFRADVFTPISLGRAGYWRGRVLEATGRKAEAKAAYAQGAEHQTSFYGLLAAEKAGLPVDPALAGGEDFGPWRSAPFTRSSVHEAAILLLASGELSLAERFWVHLAETQDRTGWGQMGQMAIELEAPHVAVMLGKYAAKQGVALPAPYYALHPLTKQRLPVPTELSLSIARRESEFDPRVVSGAGARGLMQLMPGTAKLMARDLGVEHDLDRLLSDPVYNARLGSAYLADVGREFDGNVILMAAAYNAGPGRPARWIRTFGDPRHRGVDMIDWIEHIPFRETRNYVMRVAESLPVYRARLGRDPLPLPFSRELTGSTMRPLR